jgi:hypothetical protein
MGLSTHAQLPLIIMMVPREHVDVVLEQELGLYFLGNMINPL